MRARSPYLSFNLMEGRTKFVRIVVQCQRDAEEALGGIGYRLDFSPGEED